MGAMQSQSLDLAKWAIGVRLDNHTVHDIDEALNAGKIIRTHILRPTWHFVSSDDIHWMADLSNPRLKTVYAGYCKMTGTDVSQVIRGVSVLEKRLTKEQHLTKEEIGELLQIQDNEAEQRLLRLTISYAEVEGLLCNGQLRGNKQTFTLLQEWAPRKEDLHKEEALERLARRFFTSHGPATMADFVWWSGLTATDCKKGLEAIKADFICETINGRNFWMKNDIKTPAADAVSALLLPPFDEYVVSYKDRSEMIEDAHYSKVMTKNGIFSPTVMLNGEIVGSWKKTKKKGLPHVELSFFKKMPKKIEKLFEPEVKRVERFYMSEELRDKN
jgi:hypothetical protein